MFPSADSFYSAVSDGNGRELLSEMFLLATDGEWDHFGLDCLKEPPFRRERER